jgi:hypothetical protein
MTHTVECVGSTEAHQAPPLVEGLATETETLGGGVDVSCALLKGGSVECWGNVGKGAATPTPRPVSGISDATSITTDGNGFGCARDADGSVGCWTDEGMSAVPVGEITNATAVSSGERFACALLATGEVACWEEIENPTHPPVVTQISGIKGAIAIAASGPELCALLEDDETKCLGE